ncbi:pentatricopeptide repeat-containing protein At2g35030, mitochondrial [Selaginella moellendorffii]|nr:pentatricopeptide repeat-containing protein At2g35030, mitochondrial [Selaginella moellendorffii]|eukprot:XP_002970015.2 pentatricopeptide repeat-containing protein At2g35030, mitochondrial [Selaginella moellendorffii]
MYGKCGSPKEAMAAFEKIEHKNVYSWNVLTAAFTSNGHLLKAREVFDQNPHKNHVSWTAMVAAYVQSGHIHDAKAMFDSMPVKTVSSWNAMITGYAETGDLRSAREMFDSMPLRDIVSWNAIITAYSSTSSFACAKYLFDRAPERDLVTWTAMLAAFARSGQMLEAQDFFDKMPDVNLVGWTCLIAGYADADQELEAIRTFTRMDQSGCRADHMAFVTVIDACAKIGALGEGTAIHGDVAHLGLASDVVLGTALVTLYGRCSMVERALEVFAGIAQRSVVSWSAMISALAQNNRGEDAIKFFRVMEIEGMQPNEITLASVFDACSSVPDLTLGKLLHAELSPEELHTNVVLATAVITMYGKAGGLELARQAFESSPVARTDVVSWTSMITAYARNGFPATATELLREMLLHGVRPNEITLVSLLSISSHSGKLGDGSDYFQLLLHDFGITPALEHYVCMVDLLGRSGRIKEAEDLIANMPFEPHSVPWMALLSSCRLHGDTSRRRLRERTASELVKLSSRDDAAPYALLNATR